jgi:tetratricopeptide (TPR) repeat protein
MQDPDALIGRYGEILGMTLDDEVETIELVCRLANIFYQLGKAYALTEIDPKHVYRVFQKAVPLETTRTQGRGFVDGVLSSGRGNRAGIDWENARHLFNGRLSTIEGGLAKGKRLLEEALRADSNHEEARLWLALVAVHEGRTLHAAREFQEIFETAVDLGNRGHAAIQLALLHSREQDYKTAIKLSRWVTLSGLADSEERFFFVRFNLGNYYVLTGNGMRAVETFRELLDRHPRRVGDIADLFRRSGKLRAAIDSQSGVSEALFARCPELFQQADDGPTGRGGPAGGELETER